MTYDGEHFRVAGSTVAPRPVVRGDRRHPRLYFGGGAGTTWLVGSAQDVAESLRRYENLGVTHFVLSDTPYLREIERQDEQLLPLWR